MKRWLIAITDSTGAKVQTLTYHPYGATRTNQSFTTPAVDVPYKYTGKELDSTGLYYYEARYYDPLLGRFISADTIVPNPRDPQEFNRYSYAGNNPLKYTDPTGHFKIGKFLKGITHGINKSVIGRIAGWAICAMCMQYVDHATQRHAITGTAAMAGYAIGGPLGGKLTSEAIGLAFWGAVGGAVSGGLTAIANDENTIKGAFSGAMFGAIGGYYGNNWDFGRVALNGIVGGLSSQVKGNGFLSGFATSLAVSGLTYANYEMRASERASCAITPHNCTSGGGFFGDGAKMAGNRLVAGIDGITLLSHQEAGPLGGFQGGPGQIFGLGYSVGSWTEYGVEAFAGPHDFLNNHLGGWYFPNGNGRELQELHGVYGETMNIVNVGLAAPFAGAAMIPNFAYHHLR